MVRLTLAVLYGHGTFSSMRKLFVPALAVGILFAIVFGMNWLARSGVDEPPVMPTAPPSPSLTSSETAEPTSTPTPTPTPTPVSFSIFIRYSNYWPPDGGTNCAYFSAGECLSRMSSGERWQNWLYKAISCPQEWPFGTMLVLSGDLWVCLDRGGKIEYDNGVPWVDFLTDDPAHSYGDVVESRLILSPAADYSEFEEVPDPFSPGRSTEAPIP